jgi:hypothetical protein
MPTGTITRGDFSKALLPGFQKWWQLNYKEWNPEYAMIFDKEMSTFAFDEETGVVGTGLAPVKEEGDAVRYDSMSQGYTYRYNHVVYGLGFIITREMWEDNQYAELGLRRTKSLAFSMMQTKETVAANLFNRSIDTNYKYADGQPLLSAARPYYGGGGTWSNKLATPADLSEAALEQACIDIGDFRDERGNHIKVMPNKLIIHRSDQFNAARILRSTNRVGTDYNDINALKALNVMDSEPIINHYFTDENAWFIKTDCPDGLKCKQRRELEFGNDSDFETDNAKFKATERYSFGMTDPRGVFGSEGA